MKNKIQAIGIIFSIAILCLSGLPAMGNPSSQSIEQSSELTKQIGEQTLAPPANDNFAGAIPLVLNNGTTANTASNVAATKEPGEPNHALNGGGKSVWYKFTPTATMVVQINTMEITFDTILGVYQGSSVNNLQPIGFNDECGHPCGGASNVHLKVSAGQTYYIAVDGFNHGEGNGASAGTFRLVINGMPGFPVAHNAFATPYVLGAARTGNIAGTNFNATQEHGEPLHSNSGGGKSVWYKWTATETSNYTFELSSPDNFQRVMAVHQGQNLNSLTRIASNNDFNGSNNECRVSFLAHEGQSYYIVVDGSAAQNNDGNFQLSFYRSRFKYSANFDADNFGDQDAGNSKADVAVFRQGNGTWYTTDASQLTVQWGQEGDVPVPADYTGDGVTDFAVTRNVNGQKVWYIRLPTGQFHYHYWGLAGDKPVTGDFDGDSRADIGVIRPTAQGLAWHIRLSFTNSLKTFYWGTTFDVPVLGNFDGDKYTDLAVVRNTQSGLMWYILESSSGPTHSNYTKMTSLQFGKAPDKPVAEDYDGDGKTDVAVFRPSNATWYVLRSSDGQLFAKDFGTSASKVQPADYDGDGRADLGVFQPAEGMWFILRTRDNQVESKVWGTSSDTLVTALLTISQ